MSSEYFVKLERFEGPLDLLLHLIRVHEIDIFAIDIYKLVTEYLKYLRLMKFNDLADAAQFLEMAATLIEIKSRELLPNEKDDETKLDDDVEEDPVKALQERLILYDTFKRAAEGLSQRPQLGVDIQTNHEWQRLDEVYADVEAPLKGDPAMLIVMYEQMLRDLSERKPNKIEAKMHLVSLEETIDKMLEYVEMARFSLFQGFYSKFKSRYELVVHILAVLELARSFRMKIYQQDLMGPLWIYQKDLTEQSLPLGVAPSNPLSSSPEVNV